MVVIASCTTSQSIEVEQAAPIGSQHIAVPRQAATSEAIPELVAISPQLPPPAPYIKENLHTVVVHEVPIKDLLFSLARDSKLNADLDASINGNVTITAVDQPIDTILDRIAEQGDLYYSIKQGVLKVQKDKPVLKNYRIDYLNMSRSTEGSVAVATEISSTGQGAAGGEGSGSSDNNSSTLVKNTSKNAFWDTLTSNIGAILELDPANARHGSHIIVNRETGILAVRATHRQHHDVDTFLQEVNLSSKRQVLIEATIAEVTLNNQFQAGIDWTVIKKNDSTSSLVSNLLGADLSSAPNVVLRLNSISMGGNPIQGTLRALESFGDVSIMSSPKVMALNNQTALLKVVDNLVYFNIEVNIDSSSDSGSVTTFETEVNSIPVGFVMSVTPFVSEHESVILNVRPTISRVIGQAKDPNPALAIENIVSEIPIVQVREVESVLQVSSGDIAVIGGLMQDEVTDNKVSIPFLGRIPFLGNLFSYNTDIKSKTELVIFIKPTVVNSSIYARQKKAYKRYSKSYFEG